MNEEIYKLRRELEEEKRINARLSAAVRLQDEMLKSSQDAVMSLAEEWEADRKEYLERIAALERELCGYKDNDTFMM